MTDLAKEGTKELAEMAPVERAVLALDATKTKEHIGKIVEQYGSIEVVDHETWTQAKEGEQVMLEARQKVVSTAKLAREDSTKFSKACIQIEKQLLAHDGFAEKEKALKESRKAYDAAEKARKEKLKSMLVQLEALPTDIVHMSFADASKRVTDLTEIKLTFDMCGKYLEKTEAKQEEVFELVQPILKQKKADEEAQAAAEKKAAEDAAELERLKAEQAERDAAAKKKAEEDAAELEELKRKQAETDRKLQEAKEAKAKAEQEAAQLKRDKEIEATAEPTPPETEKVAENAVQTAAPVTASDTQEVDVRPPVAVALEAAVKKSRLEGENRTQDFSLGWMACYEWIQSQENK